MPEFIINIWGVHEKKDFYGKSRDHFLSSIKEQGFTTLALWSYVSTEFIETAKDKYGFKIHSLLPSVISGEYRTYDPSKSSDGEVLDQINLKDGIEWGHAEIEKIENDSLVDKWIVVDRPWYLMFACKKDQNVDMAQLPFQDDKSKKVLLKHGIELPYTANFKEYSEWSEIQQVIFNLYMERFTPILEWCKENGKSTAFPIVTHKEMRESGSNSSAFVVIQDYISKYKTDIIALNAVINKKQWFRQMKYEHGIKLYGGTEEVIGLSIGKNGRKLMNWGYDGTVSNEHKVMNNTHPTWNQTIDEINYLKENWNAPKN